VPAVTLLKKNQRVASTPYASKMASGPTLALGRIKLATVLGGGMPFQDAMLYEHEAVGRLFASEDAREGVTAFTEKRKPNYKGT